MDRGGAIRRQVGDEVGDFMSVGWPPDRDSAQSVKNHLPRLNERAAVCSLQIECFRCRTPRDIDLAALGAPTTTFVHDPATRLPCKKCKRAGKRWVATLLQSAPQARRVTTGLRFQMGSEI